jgi:transketolase
VFTDYCRPSIRLAALMGIRVIYVMTHDSIGLGEDGPTHQPVEHLAALRAIPNLSCSARPMRSRRRSAGRSRSKRRQARAMLALTRQNLPALRTDPTKEPLAPRAPMSCRPRATTRTVTIFATGSEVEIALKAQALLAGKGMPRASSRCPAWNCSSAGRELSRRRHRHAPVKVAVEAGIRMGWDASSATEAASSA